MNAWQVNLSYFHEKFIVKICKKWYDKNSISVWAAVHTNTGRKDGWHGKTGRGVYRYLTPDYLEDFEDDFDDDFDDEFFEEEDAPAASKDEAESEDTAEADGEE